MFLGSVITITLSYHSILHINFQYYLMVDDLNTKLSNIPEDLSVIDDVSYQERIGKNLKQIIEDLLIIQEVASTFFDMQSLIMFIAMVSGGVVVLDLLYLIIIGNAPLSRVKLVGGVILAEYMVVTFCHLGQEYSDASVEFYDKLCELPWYYWSITNRKTLLMILTNTKERKISCFGLKELNYPFLLYVSIHFNQ
nr:unnamed protein product [Callosobruchus analis]